MSKIKITESTMHMFSQLQGMLGEREFKDNLNMQLKDYELTPEFVKRFKDYIDITKLSKTSLTPDMIKSLGSDFDYDAWLNHNELGNHKNIDILMDEDFFALHPADCEKLLATSKAITQRLYLKFYDSSSKDVQANMLLNYDGPEVDYDAVMKCVSALGPRFFEIPYVKEHILTSEETIQKVLDSVGIFNINMPFLMTLMVESYCPNEILNSIGNMTIKDTSTKEIEDSGNLSKYTSMVHEIIQKYPNKVLDAFMPVLYRHMPDVLKNAALLKEYLIYCDNIDEGTLISLFSEFILQGLHDELVTYAKNYNYQNLLMVIKLGA